MEQSFPNGKVYAWEQTFAIVKAKKPIPKAFAVIQDKQEITCVIEQDAMGEWQQDIVEADKDWNIITFDMLLSLNMVGFIAHITSALAKEGIDVLTFSAYSTEHVMVQSNDLAKSLAILGHMGYSVQTSSHA